MAKKNAGLGKGLGELLEDNTPTARRESVVMRSESGNIHVTPEPKIDAQPKRLFEEKPKNRSVKANFR